MRCALKGNTAAGTYRGTPASAAVLPSLVQALPSQIIIHCEQAESHLRSSLFELPSSQSEKTNSINQAEPHSMEVPEKLGGHRVILRKLCQRDRWRTGQNCSLLGYGNTGRPRSTSEDAVTKKRS